MLERNWQAIGDLKEISHTGVMFCTMRIKARPPKDQTIECVHAHTHTHIHPCVCRNMFMHSFITRSAHVKWKALVLADKHFSIVDSSALIRLVDLSAFDSKSLEAIISDKWKLYMKINIESFVREKIIQRWNKQGTGLRAVLPVIHTSTAFKLLKRLEIIIGHIFFPFFSPQMARRGYLTFTSGLKCKWQTVFSPYLNSGWSDWLLNIRQPQVGVNYHLNNRASPVAWLGCEVWHIFISMHFNEVRLVHKRLSPRKHICLGAS